MSMMTGAVAVAIAAALALSGCGGGGDDEAGEADERGATTTTQAFAGGTSADGSEQPASAEPDREPLEPVSDEWTEACETSEEMISVAWQVDAGMSADPNGIAALVVGLLDQVPPGEADEELAYARDLVDAFVAGDDLTSYEPAFRDNVEALLRAVGTGCGIEDDEPLPLPESMLADLESFLFAG